MLLASMLLAAVLTGAAPITDAGPPIVLDLPVRCAFGRTCFIQQYFDHDLGPDAKDYRCGVMVYDGHDGADIRVATQVDQRKGVDVVAAAPGVVSRVRDGMADQDVRSTGEASVTGRECGNGVMIAHAGGWETQYCHMAKGSLRVRPGQRVDAGAVLGEVGESGAAAFPHLHFTVRLDGRKVDPFAWDAPAGTCGAGHGLWSRTAAAQMPYHSPDVINIGFSGDPVTLADVESGRTAAASPSAASTVITAYVRAIGLAAGDTAHLILLGPGGAILGETDMPNLAHNRAEQLLFVGARRKGNLWPNGLYRLAFVVNRGGRSVLTKSATFTLAEPLSRPTHR